MKEGGGASACARWKPIGTDQGRATDEKHTWQQKKRRSARCGKALNVLACEWRTPRTGRGARRRTHKAPGCFGLHFLIYDFQSSGSARQLVKKHGCCYLSGLRSGLRGTHCAPYGKAGCACVASCFKGENLQRGAPRKGGNLHCGTPSEPPSPVQCYA